ncbi:helix-turn-helix transcriptional regulator [Cellulomonas fengjieae]|uniref:helix-turn-helix transcriptional regulator n=1 Tax=Cellulomonas fengjieae TaxID=2819978 RepID=UPI001AAFDB28|nr:WYL domain-containing protein [Cellulomonas fengjieae]MBO3101483.1 WYL domain-containing protein [Cellulomonas fengjieae]
MSTPASRLLSLLSLLQARRDWPGEALADRLGVSPRTVRRDVDRLRELGYPVHATKGPDGGYRLEAGTQMPPLLLDDEQAVALVVALQTTSSGVAGVDEAALRALATLRQVMPARLRAAADALQVTAVASASRHPEVDQHVLLTVGSAVRAREVLRFDYAGGGDTGPRGPRRAEAHHLVTWGGRWYLVGFDLDRADWRTFRVDKMTPKTGSGPRFAPRELPAADVAAFVAQRFTTINPWPCRGEAEVDMPASELARWAGPGALVEALGENRSRVALSAWSWDGVASTFAMFGVRLRVLGPPELVDAMHRLADRATAAVDR